MHPPPIHPPTLPKPSTSALFAAGCDFRAKRLCVYTGEPARVYGVCVCVRRACCGRYLSCVVGSLTLNAGSGLFYEAAAEM